MVPIPFSTSQGAQLATDDLGNPLIVYFAGFGSAYYTPLFLQEGEWATGRITFNQDTYYGTSFIMPYDAIVRSLYLLASSKAGYFFEQGVIVRPFVCLAVSNASDLVYTILQDTMTFTEPYFGGIEYPKHTLRRGSQTGLDIAIAEGTLVGIVLGIMAENTAEPVYAGLSASGGILLE